MSYRGGYRGPADRSRSPPRFADRRSSVASAFDSRHPGPSRNNGSDAPRGPRSQFDGPPARGPPPGGLVAGGTPRTLRDAPPLGSSDRARPFRERDYPDRRERSPPPVIPRDRSPPRKFNEARDFPPRDIDIRSARRSSRDGPPSAGSNYSDNPPFASAPTFRGGFRGRGRGDFFDRGSSRGGRRTLDDRGDLFQRRERSPPPRFGRDLSRDGRESERRDERRFERREDDRRSDWLDRERELDRSRRELPPSRLESRGSNDPVPTASTVYPTPAAPPINPERLAIIESSGADTSMRRPSSSQLTQPKREPPPETPSYLNGRAETTANRYGSRGSSPPTQAPPVPAFSFSIAPTSASNQGPPSGKVSAESRPTTTSDVPTTDSVPAQEERPAPPANAPTAPKAAPVAPKAHHASPPPSAPKAPRALELDATIPPSNRLQGVRSMENLPASSVHQAPATQPSVTSRQALPHLSQTVSPNAPSTSRFPDFAAPTAPKAARPTNQVPVSPRPPFTSPRTDTGEFQTPSAIQRSQTPPPSAPSGPRKRSFSVSPKVPTSSIPTAPKAIRAPPVAPRTGDRAVPSAVRPLDRQNALPPFAPSGPRSHQWNQWRRPGPSVYGEKLGPAIPAKRDSNGEEKDSKHSLNMADHYIGGRPPQHGVTAKSEEQEPQRSAASESAAQPVDRMDIDQEPSRRKAAHTDGHSAAQTHQSFFGKTMDKSSEDEIASSSEDDELDDEEDATLLEAKHARKERELRGQMVDLTTRDYRATSPLESIARLARLSVKDIERHNSQREDEMDVDEAHPESTQRAQPVAQTSESDDGPDVVTPQGDQNATVHIRDQTDAARDVRRVRRPTPEAISLPYLLKAEDIRPLHETEVAQDNLRALEASTTDLEVALEEELQVEYDIREDAEADFDEYFKQWREECEDFDREKEEQEKLERQASLEPGPEVEALLPTPLDPIAQSRRLLKHSSEYELELVLKQSEETARLEQEKLDREAKKVQADMEKEARLPDQETEEIIARTTIVDANRLRDPEALTLVFSYEPPADTFTETEQSIFIAAFKDTPKKWGEIASLLPGRTYKDCIHHYYANKWDGRFRDNKGKKFRGGRRGRGGKASRPSRGSALMADLNRNEDLAQANDSTTGRPKRAAAPTTFGEREVEAKGSLATQSPAKKLGPGSKDGNTEAAEKPAKKQRRAPGEGKPGRKAKSQLASLAAAPSMSPNKPFIQSKEELAREQHLRDAHLLAGLQAGPHGMMMPDNPMVFNQHHDAQIPEDQDRMKAAAPAKQSASSYWSVPEQTDFFKYIAHFGTDFAAIASHMGTKTQTMIKNHYQRQIDGGRADLHENATLADARRERGEDIGPPPTPTPVVKRKYENPQSGGTPRALAPQTEAMDIDEPLQPSQSSIPKHASPPGTQFQAKPRFTTSAQSTPIPAQRVVPSSLPVASTPDAAAMQAHRGQPSALQHPEGSRLATMMDTGPGRDTRPGFGSASGFRRQQESEHPPMPPRSQPPPGPVRTPSNPADPQYITNLQKEQERAMQLQHQQEQQMRQPHMMLPHTHGSPASQPLVAPMLDRKPMLEERGPTPPRSTFPPSGASRASIFGPMGINPMATPGGIFSSRGPFNSSTPKHEMSRPGSVATSAPLQAPPVHTPAALATPAPAATPAPEPPKRSNVMSLLNSEPEETKPAPKRDSLPSAPTRIASPAPSTFPPTSAPQQMPNLSSRRETFGQASVPHSHFHRPSFGQHGSSTPNPPPASLKQESSQGSASSIQQAPKHEWPGRVIGPGNHASPPHPTSLDRESRPPFYQPHRSSMLGHLGPNRVNPSPPPNSQHSRTSSLSGQQQGLPPREQRSALGGPPTGGPHQSSQSLHSNPYGGQQQFPPFSQAPAQAQNRAHHSHNNSLTEAGSGLQRVHGSGREELFRREEEVRAQRDRDEQQMRYDAISRERSQQHDAQRRDVYNAQRFQEQEMERQRQQQQHQAYSRGPMPPQPLGPQSYNSPFGGPRMSHGGIREQSQREVDSMVAQQAQAQERRMIEDHERRRQQEHQQMPPQSYMDRRDPQADPYGRRPEEQMYPSRRNTPYGGPYSQPPPPRR